MNGSTAVSAQIQQWIMPMLPIVSTTATFLGLFGVPAAISAAVAAYAVHFARDTISEKIKSSIKAEYDRSLELLKAELKIGGDLELERHKHTLALEANRQNLLFARLHEKRAAVISDVYAALSETYEALMAYVVAFEPVGIPSLEKRFAVLAESHDKFRKAYTNNRIYFPEHLSKKLEDINRHIFSAGNTFMFGVPLQEGTSGRFEAWLKVSEDVKGPIGTSLKELEGEFRSLMNGKT